MEFDTEVYLRLNHGKDKAITGAELARRVGAPKRTRQVRLAINRLIEKGHPIIGSERGYFIADDPADCDTNIRLLVSYIANTQKHITALENAAKNINGQGRLI